jgi:16S rRNA (cytosine1402-N4)-methyltransferase
MTEFDPNREAEPEANPGSAARHVHVPVLLKEVLQNLQLEPGQVVVDGTVGAAGHSRQIFPRIQPAGTLIGLDRDALMLEKAAHQLSAFPCHLYKASYAELPDVLAGLQIPAVDRILLDLGLSSDQLADHSRGFSFAADGPLDLRFDVTQGEPASELVARLGEQELAELFERYGEEPHSRRLARNIVEWRKQRPIRTGLDLAHAIEGAGANERSSSHGTRPQRPRSPGHQQRAGRHPATRVFQALRIAVNRELDQLEAALGGVLFNCLKPGGIVVIISFHSLEDRLVKLAFRDSKLWQPLCPKPITASPAEQRFNPRSRTARLRAAKRNP